MKLWFLFMTLRCAVRRDNEDQYLHKSRHLFISKMPTTFKYFTDKKGPNVCQENVPPSLTLPPSIWIFYKMHDGTILSGRLRYTLALLSEQCSRNPARVAQNWFVQYLWHLRRLRWPRRPFVMRPIEHLWRGGGGRGQCSCMVLQLKLSGWSGRDMEIIWLLISPNGSGHMQCRCHAQSSHFAMMHADCSVTVGVSEQIDIRKLFTPSL